MKTLHINVHVKDIESSVAFYSGLFNSEPVVRKEDYAKWSPKDLLLNFSISLSATESGINHLGIETDKRQELDELYKRLDSLEGTRQNEGDTVCCYAKSHKNWIKDPQQVEWEIFQTYGESDTYGERFMGSCCKPTEEAYFHK